MFKFSYKPIRLCLLVSASMLLLSEFALAEDRSQLFQSFEIEGLSVGLGFTEAVSKAELREYRLVNPDSRQLTKKEADGSGKSLIFEVPFLEDEFPELKIVWRIAYQKRFPQTLSFDPDTVLTSLKQKYGAPDKDYQDNQGRHTLIYYRDKSRKAEIRFETIKTWRDQVFNVTMSDVNMKTAGRAAYNEKKSAKTSAQQQVKPKAAIDY